ncbi:MAG: hypothetical protein P8X46_12205 [Nitrospirales bacterium]
MKQSKAGGARKAVLVPLDSEGLAPQETPWEEFLRIFTKDYQALFGFWVLMILLLTALAGKALTEWWVVFDPEVVRLTDKFLPPLSGISWALMNWGVTCLPECSKVLLCRYLLDS